MGFLEDVGVPHEEWTGISSELAKELNGSIKKEVVKKMLEAKTTQGQAARKDFIKTMMIGLILRS